MCDDEMMIIVVVVFLFFFEPCHLTSNLQRLHLQSVAVLEVAKFRFMAACSTRSLATSGVVDYVYFSVPKQEAFSAWKAAFDAHNERITLDELCDTELRESATLRRGALSRSGMRESAGKATLFLLLVLFHLHLCARMDQRPGWTLCSECTRFERVC